MAQYSHLPIYKIAYDMMLAVVQVTKEFPREFKYSIGERIQESVIKLLINIYKANSAKDKAEHITKIIEQVQYINLFLRISRDLHLIPDNRYAAFVEQTASIAKQSNGWLQSFLASTHAQIL